MPDLANTIPLSRLGCGGVNGNESYAIEHRDANSNHPHAESVPEKETCDGPNVEDPIKPSSPRSVPPGMTVPHDSISSPAERDSSTKPMAPHSEEVEGNATRSDAPPPFFHAMPLPRLGCGGPPQCVDGDAKGSAKEDVATTTAETNHRPAEDEDDDEKLAANLLRVCQQVESQTAHFHRGPSLVLAQEPSDP